MKKYFINDYIYFKFKNYFDIKIFFYLFYNLYK